MREEQDLSLLSQLCQHLESCGGAGIVEIYQQIIGNEGKRMRAPEIVNSRAIVTP